MLIGRLPCSTFFFFNDTATTEIYTLSLHDALPIYWIHDEARLTRDTGGRPVEVFGSWVDITERKALEMRSEEHTSELQSQSNLVCRLLLEKKKQHHTQPPPIVSCGCKTLNTTTNPH